MYPLLSEFANVVTQMIGSGERKVLVDLSAVGYVDNATIRCHLMDLYRQASAAGERAETGRRPEARRDHADDDGRARTSSNCTPMSPAPSKSFGA